MAINSNIIQLNIITSEDIILVLAGNIKQRRLELNLTQQGFATRAGLKLETYRRFERTGNISLKGFAKIVSVIGGESQLQSLFSERVYRKLDDVINEPVIHKRGKKNE